jgi:hypothetical protein
MNSLFFESYTVSLMYTIFPFSLKWSSLQKEGVNLLKNLFFGFTRCVKYIIQIFE